MDSLMGLPSVQWPDIYTYLSEKPSIYTKEKLNACKSLDIHDQDLQYNNLSEDILSRLKLMMRYILITYYILI